MTPQLGEETLRRLAGGEDLLTVLAVAAGGGDGNLPVSQGIGQTLVSLGRPQEIPGGDGEFHRIRMVDAAPLHDPETGEPHVFHGSTDHPHIAGMLRFHEDDTDVIQRIHDRWRSFIRRSRARAGRRRHQE